MKSITQTVTYIAIFAALIFGVFLASSQVVDAQTSCGSCGAPDPAPAPTSDPVPSNPSGGGSGGGGGSTPNLPSCTISANITAVEANGQYVVSWEGTPNATYEVNNAPVSVPGSATYTMSPASEYERYVIYGVNQDGECADEVVVTQQPVCSIDVSLDVANIGDMYTVSWSATPAFGNYQINGNNVGDSGSVDFQFAGPNRDSFTLTGDNGALNCTASVEVTAPVSVVPACTAFGITETTITPSSNITLNWATANVTNVSIDNGIGAVGQNGTNEVFAAPAAVGTYTYTLTFDGQTNATCVDTLTVQNTVTPNPDTPDITIVKRDAADGDDTQTVNVGGTATFEIIVTNNGDEDLVNVTVTDPLEPACDNGIGALAVGASDTYTCATTNVQSSFTNVANVTGDSAVDGDTVTDSDPTEVRIDNGGGGGGGGGSSSPRCEFEISAEEVSSGDEVTLTWETSRATEVTITDDQGNVIITTEDLLSDEKRDLYDGETTVTITRDTTFTLLAERGSRDRDCEVSVEIDGNSGTVLLQTRDQAPLVTGISLTQVPHTGFEAGTIMTTLFYIILVAWALYLAYVLVIPKTVTATVASRNYMQEAESVRPDVFTPKVAPTPVVTSTTSATAAAPANLPVAPVATETIEAVALETIAHANQTLLSTDALVTFMNNVPADSQQEKMVAIATAAKALFPLEDGWVVVNNDRMKNLLAAE